jgi:hypothetical protein
MRVIRKGKAPLEAVKRRDGGRRERRGHAERRRAPRQQRLAEHGKRDDGRECGDADASHRDLGDARVAKRGLHMACQELACETKEQ